MSDKNARLVFSVLKRISKERLFVERAFTSWYREYGQAKLLDPDELVAFLDREVGFDSDEKRAFRIAYYSFKSRSPDELSEVPRVLMTAPTVGVANGQAELAAEDDDRDRLNDREYMFTVFLEQLLNLARKRSEDSLADIVEYFSNKQNQSRVKLSSTAVRAVLDWTGQELSESIEAQSLQESEMRELFHHIYISLCESLGPVETDRILSRSLERSDQDARASAFPPSNFI